MNKEDVLRILEGKTDDEKREFLKNNFNLNWEFYGNSCKLMFAQVFTYCHTRELQTKLDFFFFLVNTFGYLWNICFKEESTSFLGCNCSCGKKQIILYYSITQRD